MPVFTSDSHAWLGWQKYTWTWTDPPAVSRSVDWCRVTITPSDEQLMRGERCHNCCRMYTTITTCTTTHVVSVTRRRTADVDPYKPVGASDSLTAFLQWAFDQYVKANDKINPLWNLGEAQGDHIKHIIDVQHARDGGDPSYKQHYAFGLWQDPVQAPTQTSCSQEVVPGPIECPCRHSCSSAEACNELRATLHAQRTVN